MAFDSVSFDPDSVASNSDAASSALAAAAAASDVASSAAVAAAKGSDASSKIAAKSATWDKASAASSVAAAAIPKANINAKGDLIVGTADDTPGILSAGTDDYVLRIATDTPAWESPPWSQLVERGSRSASDWDDGDLTTDATWNDLDLSSIVPAGAAFVLLRVSFDDNAVGSLLQFRKNGDSSSYNPIVRTQVVNIVVDAELLIACDSSRVIEYYGSNLTFNAISITVLGWFL